MTDVLVNVLGKNPEYTFIVIEEVSDENWGHKGTSVAERKRRPRRGAGSCDRRSGHVEGRICVAKKALMKDITDAVVRHFAVAPECVVFQIVESPKDSMSRGDVPSYCELRRRWPFCSRRCLLVTPKDACVRACHPARRNGIACRDGSRSRRNQARNVDRSSHRAAGRHGGAARRPGRQSGGRCPDAA